MIEYDAQIKGRPFLHRKNKLRLVLGVAVDAGEVVQNVIAVLAG